MVHWSGHAGRYIHSERRGRIATAQYFGQGHGVRSVVDTMIEHLQITCDILRCDIHPLLKDGNVVSKPVSHDKPTDTNSYLL